MDIVEYLTNFGGYVIQGTKYNQYSTQPINYKFNTIDVDKFNQLYKYLYNSDLNIIERTASDSIRKGPKYRTNNYAWDLREYKTGARLTVIVDGKVWVFRIGNLKEESGEMAPWKAWNEFNKVCTSNGIDLYNYMIDNGEEIKKEIPNPLIQMHQYMGPDDKPLENVHHIDFHNSYPAGLCNTHPEFRKVIEPMYKLRKIKPEFKFILNCTVGCMQSNKHLWKARWAHLAKDAITDNNNRVKKLAAILTVTGRKILGFNTDGIWYQGEIYHGKGEGNELGDWSNDHINCLFRSKSDGAYEFVENGVYHPVVRGFTKLDIIKDRKYWDWGDIYREEAETLKFVFKEGVGIIYEDKQA